MFDIFIMSLYILSPLVILTLTTMQFKNKYVEIIVFKFILNAINGKSIKCIQK